MTIKRLLFAVFSIYQLLRFVFLGVFLGLSAMNDSGAIVSRTALVFGSGAIVVALLGITTLLPSPRPHLRVLRIGKSAELAASLYAITPSSHVLLFGTIAVADAIALLFLLLSKEEPEREIAVLPTAHEEAVLPEVETIEIEEE